MLTANHIIFIIFTVAIVTAAGLWSIRRVRTSADFSLGGRAAGTSIIVGTITGTMVGGSSTIGTAQLAYQYGISAWWFTLGAGFGTILLGLFLAKPLRNSGVATAPSFLGKFYGGNTQLVSSIFSSVGTFLAIVGQVLSAVALLSSMFSLNSYVAALLSLVFIICYVVFGGVWGTGFVGVLKISLIYISLMITGFLAYFLAGGIGGLSAALPAFPWFHPFGRGAGTDLAAFFSVQVGIMSTQTYLQAMFSGKDARVSCRGAVISGLIVPPIGLAGVMVGMFMRTSFPNINAKEALPMFILNYLPDWLGGIALATLLISAVGTAAGLLLGISTMLTQDIYVKYLSPQAPDKSILLFSKVSIIVLAVISLAFVAGNINSLILQWTILSMGLRGASICLPLLYAVFLKDFVHLKAGRLAIVLAPSAAILWTIAGTKDIDPLYISLLVGFAILTLGSLGKEKEKKQLIIYTNKIHK